jgi:hypothetical protein
VYVHFIETGNPKGNAMIYMSFEEATRRAAGNPKDWFVKPTRVHPGMYVVWSRAGAHYVEFDKPRA